MDPADIPTVEQLLQLVRHPAADSSWFSVAKRFFLYGGAKEFNPCVGELDRILDFSVALEAVLVFENDFVGRLLRNRAIRLLEIEGDAAMGLKRLLSEFYGYRSKLAHGEPLEIANPAGFHVQMEAFEHVVRAVLKVGLAKIPAADDARKQSLVELAAVTDSDRLEFITQRVKGLQNGELRQRVVEALKDLTDA